MPYMGTFKTLELFTGHAHLGWDNIRVLLPQTILTDVSAGPGTLGLISRAPSSLPMRLLSSGLFSRVSTSRAYFERVSVLIEY